MRLGVYIGGMPNGMSSGIGDGGTVYSWDGFFGLFGLLAVILTLFVVAGWLSRMNSDQLGVWWERVREWPYWLTIEPVDGYWELSADELTYRRVVYNLLHKPGFRWLVADLFLGAYMAVVLVRKANLIWFALGNWLKDIKKMWKRRFWLSMPEVRGTVDIDVGSGVIYAAGV